EHERRPSLRPGRVASLVEQLGIEPAYHRPAATGPQRVVGIVTELQVVGLKASVDKSILHGLRIEPGELAVRLLQWEEPGRGMIGALLPEVGIGGAAQPRRKPDPSML